MFPNFSVLFFTVRTAVLLCISAVLSPDLVIGSRLIGSLYSSRRLHSCRRQACDHLLPGNPVAGNDHRRLCARRSVARARSLTEATIALLRTRLPSLAPEQLQDSLSGSYGAQIGVQVDDRLQLGATAGVRGVVAFLAGVARSAIFSRKAVLDQHYRPSQCAR